MAAKENKPIIIEGWDTGIAPSGERGFTDMRNVDTHTLPGVLLNSFTALKKSSTTITGLPMWFVANIDNAKTVYCLDNGQVVYSTDRTSSWSTWTKLVNQPTSTGHGNGMAIFNGYLIVAGDSKLDVLNIGAGTWTNAWQVLSPDGTNTASDTSVNPMFLSTNGTLYGGMGVSATPKLGAALWSLVQKPAKVFSPTDNTTYTFQGSNIDQVNPCALQLPYPVRIRCLTQFGNNLMIGTFIGTTNAGDIISDIVSNPIAKVSDIYPWDRTSATFNLPVRLWENGINQLLAIGNILFIQAGQWGQFYTYNGYFVQPLFQFPHNTTAGQYQGGTYYPTIFYPGAIMYHRNRLYFGVSEGNASLGASGVYSVGLDGKGLQMDNLISAGTTLVSTVIGALLPHLDGSGQLSHMIGWQNATAQGVDLVTSGNSFSTDYSSYVDSQWYQIGTADFPGTLARCLIHLEENLLSNDAIRISYRYDKTTLSFTTLCTFDNATYGQIAELGFPAGSISGRKVHKVVKERVVLS